MKATKLNLEGGVFVVFVEIKWVTTKEYVNDTGSLMLRQGRRYNELIVVKCFKIKYPSRFINHVALLL